MMRINHSYNMFTGEMVVSLGGVEIERIAMTQDAAFAMLADWFKTSPTSQAMAVVAVVETPVLVAKTVAGRISLKA